MLCLLFFFFFFLNQTLEISKQTEVGTDTLILHQEKYCLVAKRIAQWNLGLQEADHSAAFIFQHLYYSVKLMEKEQKLLPNDS